MVIGWETDMTVGGVDMLGGLGVVAEDVFEVTDGTDDVTGIVARERGGEVGKVFVVGKVSDMVGAKDNWASCAIRFPLRNALYNDIAWLVPWWVNEFPDMPLVLQTKPLNQNHRLLFKIFNRNYKLN